MRASAFVTVKPRLHLRASAFGIPKPRRWRGTSPTTCQCSNRERSFGRSQTGIVCVAQDDSIGASRSGEIVTVHRLSLSLLRWTGRADLLGGTCSRTFPPLTLRGKKMRTYRSVSFPRFAWLGHLFKAAMIVSVLTIKTFAADSPTPSAVPDKPVDVSKIVGKSQAENILGEPVREPKPLNNSGADGYYSKCNYYSSKSVRSLLVRVRQASAGSIDPQKEFEQVTASGGAMKPVDGLGDKAGMFNGTPQNGLPANVIMLYVVKGNAFVTVGLGGMKDEAAALEKAEGVARKILAKL